MNEFKFFEWLLIKLPLFAGGFIGAIAHMTAFRPKSFRAALAIVFCGMALAYYGSPALTDYWNISSENIRHLFAFGFGMTGMTIVAGAIKMVQATAANPAGLKGVINAYIKKIAGGESGGSHDRQ